MPTRSSISPSRSSLFALLGWIAACQPALEPGSEPPVVTQEDDSGAVRTVQSARIPRISAVSPPLASNLGGAGITITGTSFQPGCQVYIGGQPAPFAYASSSTQIAVSTPSLPMPAGPVAVKVQNPDGRQSERSDVLTLFNDNLSLIALRSGINILGMQLAQAVDLNADGKQDLVLYDNVHVRILLGRGRGDYSEGQTIAIPAAMSLLVDVGDFNGDGKPDLIVNNGFWSPEVDIYLNLGSGTFGTPLATTLTTLSGFFAAYVGDVNNDGRADLVVAGQTMLGAFTLQSFLAGSDGRLGAPALTTITRSTGQGQLKDVNGDGKVDLIAASPGANEIAWFAGKGDGTFATPTATAVGAPSVKLVLADFNADGKLDLASLGSDGNVSLRLGLGTGAFTGTAVLTGNANARTLAQGDLTGDGKVDLLLGWDKTFTGMTTTPGGVALLAGNGDGTFQMPRALALAPAAGASQVQILDADSDGKQDVLVISYYDGLATVLYGRGGGSFFEDAQLPAAPTALVSADLNGDGKADVVAVSVSTNKLYVMLGNGDGTTAAPKAYDSDRGPSALLVADVNADGKADLLVSNYDAATVSLLLGNGDGTLQPQRVFNVGSGANALIAADLNSDARIDVVTANYDANTVSVLLNNGAGGFSAAKSFATGTGPTALAAGDFNGDGRMDVVTANADANSISYLQGSAVTPGTLNTAKSVAAGKGPSAIFARDVNGDGKLDVLTGNADSGDVSLLAGKGDGTFNASSVLAQVGHVAEMALVDLSGDGRPDLVVSGGSPARVTLLYGFMSAVFATSARSLLVGGPLATPDMNGDGKPDLLVGQPSGALLLHLNNTR